MNPSQLIKEPYEKMYASKRRVVVRPVPLSHKLSMNFGDLGQQEVNVLYTREQEGIDIHSVSWHGLVITTDIIDLIDLAQQVQEETE